MVRANKQEDIGKREANLQLLDDFLHLRGQGRTLYKKLLNYIRGFGACYEDAEDVLTDTQLKLHELRKKGGYDPDKHSRGLIYKTAYRSWIDLYRKNKNWNKRVPLDINTEDDPKYDGDGFLEYEPADSNPEPLEILQGAEIIDSIRTRINELPEQQRLPIILVRYHRLKFREVAEVLDIPPGTVKSRYHAGLETLEGKLRRELPNDVLPDILDLPIGSDISLAYSSIA